jgi:hypothetical protein
MTPERQQSQREDIKEGEGGEEFAWVGSPAERARFQGP